MVDLTRVLAVIPARAGSKRLPDKNMKLLAGMPLVGWAIQHAKAAGVPTIIVSSDDLATLDYAAGLGVITVKRPPELSEGKTPPIWNVRHAVKCLPGTSLSLEFIVYLQPTSPFRKAEDILSALRVAENTGADSVVTVRKPREELYHLGHAGRLRLLTQTDMGAVFTPNGAVYVITKQHLDAGGDWWDGIVEGHLMPEDRSLDIDLHEDFDAAEKIAETMLQAGAL
jgi:CMP-N,N'-diacetyllegionaminic acid synthase